MPEKDGYPIYISKKHAYTQGMKRKYFKSKQCAKSALLLLVISGFAQTYAVDNESHDYLYFKDIYHTRFKSIEQAEKAKEENQFDFQTLLEYANFYYITGAGLPLKSKLSVEYSLKALEVYQALWKKRFSDPRMQLLMANALLFQGTNPNINIGTLVEYVFRGRNLYSMIIDRYPQNLEARLGRARINMGLNSATGRPDAIHREDIRIYLEGYPKLPKDMQDNPYFKPGLHEMYLAKAMLAIEVRQWQEAEKYLKLIDPSCLFEHALKMYDEAIKKIEKGAPK